MSGNSVLFLSLPPFIMDRRVRVRFAPSPTGPLHIGGVRTALYNYLFAKKHGGDFLIRIEDTDQTRYVPGAEDYIIESLKWLGITADEGVGFGPDASGGPHAPYRQSERKPMYRQYAMQLIDAGYAYVVRIKLPKKEDVKFHDEIRGWVNINTAQMDDKVLFKSDGMPTYHLANVVDDYLMNISHVIRDEEWLPSAPLHVLLYRYLGWEEVMPQFAHLPLLLKPDGNGKLSKRDGDRLGFPVFPLEWKDPFSGEISSGYREKGYIPEAFVNMLALLGWNPGTTQEIFSMDELVEAFTVERISKSGAKFDAAKTKWFNQQYLRSKSNADLADIFLAELNEKGISTDKNYVEQVCALVKEKAQFSNEFWSLASYFFEEPTAFDAEVIKKRWKDQAPDFIGAFTNALASLEDFSHTSIENLFKST